MRKILSIDSQYLLQHKYINNANSLYKTIQKNQIFRIPDPSMNPDIQISNPNFGERNHNFYLE